MAIFEIKDKKVNRIKPTEFTLEKDLQNLVEQNLELTIKSTVDFEDTKELKNIGG